MTRRYSLPFKTILGNEIVAGPWHYRINGGDWLRVEEEGVPGWDYLATLEFTRGVEVNGARVRETCGLKSESELHLTVTIHSPSSRCRQLAFATSLPSTAAKVSPILRLRSAELAEYLRLETEIVLVRGAAADEHFAARMQGSRLFTESVRVELEGNRSRMPVEAVSFDNQLPWLEAPKAPWFVSCDSTDLHAPVMRVLRLYLNSDQPAYLEAASRSDSMLVSLMGADVAAHLILTALDDAEFTANTGDYEKGSLGEAAGRLVALCFPAIGREDVRSLAERNPAKFAAIVRSIMVPNNG